MQVSLETLMDMWTEDAPINEHDPHLVLAKIPNLHAKYSRIMSTHNIIAKKYEQDYKKFASIKWKFHLGKMSKTEIEEKGLDPYDSNEKVRRQDISVYLDSDEELEKILLKKTVHLEIVEFAKGVLRELNNRTFQCNNIIKWKMFLSGQ